MPELTADQKLSRLVNGEVPLSQAVQGLIDRGTSMFQPEEGEHLDYKLMVDMGSNSSIGELARDMLAFSNRSGGLLIVGVEDNKVVRGVGAINAKGLRQQLTTFIGTRVFYRLENVNVSALGSVKNVVAIAVERAQSPFPNLLKQTIEIPGKLGRRVKYLKGSLFYRDGDRTQVEPAGGDLESRAISLGFTGAGPRTRSSFVIEVDKPGLRLYAHINDRFFGRETELAELLSRFDDARGRGISVAGEGGIGKTELAIEVARKLLQRNRFKLIYSGSAKTTLLTSGGPQPAEPIFWDLPSFLKDLAAWLGFDLHKRDLSQAKTLCVDELRKLPGLLLFIDNLETVTDGRLFQFLSGELPDNVWLLLTSRTHKVRNFLALKELGPMEPRDAAKLLRHEFQQQGMQELADKNIQELESVASQLHRHPLAIRWFAWWCRRDSSVWAKGPGLIPKKELEEFCVGHTLRNLPDSAKRALMCMVVVQSYIELTPATVAHVADLPADLDIAIYELESAGLVLSEVDADTGEVTYSVNPLAIVPARELAREHDLERTFVDNMSRFRAKAQSGTKPDALLNFLLQYPPRRVRELSRDEIQELKRRIERVNARPHDFVVEMESLSAECERHMDHIVSADEHYTKAAAAILAKGKQGVPQYRSILVEAATVAKQAARTQVQLQRAASYLEAAVEVEQTLRSLGMLAEIYALLHDEDKYRRMEAKANRFIEEDPLQHSVEQLEVFHEAMARSERHLQR